jgi:hypothetical protein
MRVRRARVEERECGEAVRGLRHGPGDQLVVQREEDRPAEPSPVQAGWKALDKRLTIGLGDAPPGRQVDVEVEDGHRRRPLTPA